MKFVTFLMALVLILAASCGAEQLSEQLAEVDKIAQQPQPFYCDINEAHHLIERTQLLEDRANLKQMLAFRDSLSPGSIYRAYTTYRLGAIYADIDQDSSNLLYNQALETFSQADTIVVERIGRICNNLASVYDGVGQYKKQRRYALDGIKVMLGHESCAFNSANLLPELHLYAGNALLGLEDIGEALRYYRLGINHFGVNTAYYVKANLYDRYANALIEAGKTEPAGRYLDSARFQFEQTEELDALDALDLASVYDTYHRLAKLRGDELAALRGNEQALILRLKSSEGTSDLAFSYNNLGRLYCLNGQAKKGAAYLKNALRLFTKAGKISDRGGNYESLALSQMINGDTLAALAYLDSAALDYHGSPGNPSVTAALDPAGLRDPLMTRARLLTHLHDSRPAEFPLSKLEAAFARVDSLSDLLRFNVRTEESKRLVIRNLRALYEAAISTSLNRYKRSGESAQLDFALRYLEKGKAEILRERRALSSKTTTVWNTDLQDDGYQSSKVFSEAGGGALQQLSNTLADDHYILDYFVGDQNVYLAEGKQGVVSLHRLSVTPDDLKKTIAQFRSAITAPGKTKWRGKAAWRNEQLRLLATSSHQLYNAMIGEVFQDRNLARNLTVIPDGEIWKVPFNALITSTVEDPSNTSSWPYLQKDHLFNYDFSARMWLERRKPKQLAGSRTLVIAPVQEERYTVATPLGDSLSLSPLTMVDEEINAIRQAVDIDLWQGAEALRFKDREDELGQYRIIHFSGHGVAFPTVPEASFLAVQLQEGQIPELLRLPALENRRLPVELLILSACQTGDGEVSSAEGMISLARAGALAGANSVIASYWNVSQAYKPLLIERFYEQLGEQVNRFEALHAAQVFVKEENSTTHHPFYWAAFQNIGSGEPLLLEFN